MVGIEYIFEADDSHDWQQVLMETSDKEALKELQERCNAVSDFIDTELQFREEHPEQ